MGDLLTRRPELWRTLLIELLSIESTPCHNTLV